jgi:hypothetical protein
VDGITSRGWDDVPECHGFEAGCRNQETSIAERRVSITFPFLSVRFLGGKVSIVGMGQIEEPALLSSRMLR